MQSCYKLSHRSKKYAEKWSARRQKSLAELKPKTPVRQEAEFTPDPLSSNRFKINEGICKKMNVVPKKLFP